MEVVIRLKAGDTNLGKLFRKQDLESKETFYQGLYEILSTDPFAIAAAGDNLQGSLHDSYDYLTVSSVLQTLETDISKTPPVHLSLHVLACISSMCCSLTQGEARTSIDVLVQRVLQDSTGPYGKLFRNCFQQIIATLHSVNGSNVLEPNMLEHLKACFFVLKWQSLPSLMRSMMNNILVSLNYILRLLGELRKEQDGNSIISDLEVYLCDTVRLLLCQCDENVDDEMTALWAAQLLNTWRPLGFSLGSLLTNGNASPMVGSVLRILDKYLDSAMFARTSLFQPETALTPMFFHGQMCSIAAAAESLLVTKADLILLGCWWRCLVGFCSFELFHECCVYTGTKDGSRQTAPPTFHALQLLLKDQHTYFSCCLTLARTIVGRSYEQRREYCKHLEIGTQIPGSVFRSRHLHMLLRALQPWLVPHEGAKLRTWTPVASKYITATLKTLFGAAWPNIDIILKIPLGSRTWKIADRPVDLRSALESMLSCKFPGFAKLREDSYQEQDAEKCELQEYIFCGVCCVVAMLDGASGLLAIPTNGKVQLPVSVTTGGKIQGNCVDIDEECQLVSDAGWHPDTWSDEARSACRAVSTGGLFAQRAAEPRAGILIPPMTGSGILLQSLQFIERAFIALGHGGKFEDLPKFPASVVSDFTVQTQNSSSNYTCASSASENVLADLCVYSSVKRRRASLLCSLSGSWQSLLNAIGRSVVIFASAVLSSSSANSQIPSQLAFTCEAGASQAPGARHRVYAMEDDVLNMTLSSVFKSHVNVWGCLWAPHSVCPGYAARAREGYLEALWWLLHRLSAFNVIQEPSLTLNLHKVIESSRVLLPRGVLDLSTEATCALWFVLLPSIIHTRALESDLDNFMIRRLLYAVSRCQRALLHASPPVLEEILDWLPDMLHSLSARLPHTSRDAKNPTDARFYIRSVVKDERPSALLLGTLWQTVVFSLTQELDMSSFWGWSQLDAFISNATPYDATHSTTEVVAMSIRKALTSPFELLRSGQSGLCLWMRSFPYTPESSTKSPRDCWQSLCHTWLPYEYLLAKHATDSESMYSDSRGGKELYRQTHTGRNFYCGGVYTGNCRGSVLSSQEILIAFDLLDFIARTIHQSPVQLPQLLICTWRRFLLDHLVAICVGWCEACGDIIQDEVPLDPLVVENRALSGIQELIGSLQKPHWIQLLNDENIYVVVVEEPVLNGNSLASSTISPQLRIRNTASGLTLSPAPSASSGLCPLASFPASIREISYRSVMELVAEVFVNCILQSIDVCVSVVSETRAPHKFISVSQLMQYSNLLLRESEHMIAVICAFSSQASLETNHAIYKQIVALRAGVARVCSFSLGSPQKFKFDWSDFVREDISIFLAGARSLHDVCDAAQTMFEDTGIAYNPALNQKRKREDEGDNDEQEIQPDPSSQGTLVDEELA